MAVEGIFTAFRTTLTGLNTEMKKLEVISENVANAEKSPDKNGKVYKRKIVISNGNGKRFSRGFDQEMTLKLKKSEKEHITLADDNKKLKLKSNTKIFNVVELEGDQLIYNPAHPRADKNGYVRMPNVNMVEEMVDLMSASRAYEANVNVMTAGKKMAKDALKI